MKLNIGEYEVEIKAKGPRSNRYNKEDTMYLLNRLSLAINLGLDDRNSLERSFRDMADGIYDQLAETGFYDNK